MSLKLTTFNATHMHADGGLYEVLDFPRLKHPTTGQWVSGVLYRNGEDILCIRTLENFEQRFKELG